MKQLGSAGKVTTASLLISQLQRRVCIHVVFFSFLVVRQHLTHSSLDNHCRAKKSSLKETTNKPKPKTTTEIQQKLFNQQWGGVGVGTPEGHVCRACSHPAKGQTHREKAQLQKSLLPSPRLPYAPFPLPPKCLRKELFLDSSRKKNEIPSAPNRFVTTKTKTEDQHYLCKVLI